MGPGGAYGCQNPTVAGILQQTRSRELGQGGLKLKRGFSTAASMPQFGNLPPTNDEAIVAKSQELWVEHKQGFN